MSEDSEHAPRRRGAAARNPARDADAPEDQFRGRRDAAERAERRAAALRENLRRRKRQQRLRGGSGGDERV